MARRRIAIFIIGSAMIGLLGFFAGCGKFRARDDRTVVVKPGTDNSNEVSSGSLDHVPPELKPLFTLILLFHDNKGIPKDATLSFARQFAAQIADIFGGTMTPEKLVDLLFEADANHDNVLTLDEFENAITSNLPALRWITADRPITFDDLETQILKQYKDASKPAVEGLAQALFMFDKKWAGGNEDGLLSQQEISVTQLVIGLLDKIDFNSAFQLDPNATPFHKMLVHALFYKINQQIFNRGYPENILTFDQLSPSDLRLEWMQLAVRFFVISSMVNLNGVSGNISDADAARVFSLYGPPHSPNWKELRKIYDNPLFKGNGDSKLNAFESFNLLTDLDYSHKVLAYNHQNLLPGSLDPKGYFMNQIVQLFPNVGGDLFLEGNLNQAGKDKMVRAGYWNDLQGFDRTNRGGDGNGTLDDGELTYALAYARILEMIYFIFDVNPRDGLISRAEFQILAKTFLANKLDPWGFGIEAFFDNKGLDGNPNIVDLLLTFFTSGGGVRTLAPYDFYVRLEQVIGQYLAPNPVGSTATPPSSSSSSLGASVVEIAKQPNSEKSTSDKIKKLLRIDVSK